MNAPDRVHDRQTGVANTQGEADFGQREMSGIARRFVRYRDRRTEWSKQSDGLLRAGPGVAKRLKILWLSPGFPRPTNRGGQIRTLEILRCLHLRHEIHFLALHDDSTEAIRRSSEYCSRAWPVPYALAPKGSIRFWMQSVRGLVAREPAVVARKHSRSRGLRFSHIR